MCRFAFKEVIRKLKARLLTDTQPELGDSLVVCFVDTMGNGEVIVMAKRASKNG